MNLIVVFLLLVIIYLIVRDRRQGYHRPPPKRPTRPREHFGSDYSNSFYGVTLWDGWPY